MSPIPSLPNFIDKRLKHEQESTLPHQNKTVSPVLGQICNFFAIEQNKSNDIYFILFSDHL